MKKTLICLAITATTLVACNTSSTKPTETESKKTIMDTVPATPKVADVFSCPMHPEVTGNKDEKCPKCGMALTVPVK